MKIKKVTVTPAITLQELLKEAEMYVRGGELSFTEAICEICQERDIDPRDIAKIIKGPLKDRLEAEAMDRNIIKRTTAKLT